jgi:hypothetical protein
MKDFVRDEIEELKGCVGKRKMAKTWSIFKMERSVSIGSDFYPNTRAHQGSVVQRWVSANPWLKFNLLS